jgi:hypothetical protein
MHIFRVRNEVYDPVFKCFLQPGRWYLAESQNATPMVFGQPSALEARFPGVELKPLKWEEYGFRTVPRYDDPNEKVWVIRAGGYGDLFYLLPVMKAIASKIREPERNLVLQTAMDPFPSEVPMRFVHFPSTLDEIPRDFAVLNMEDIPGEMENEGAGSSTARYARRAGLNENDLDFTGLFPKWLEEKGVEKWREWFGSRRPRIVIALTASAATRSVPTALQIALTLQNRAAIYFASPSNMPLPFPCGNMPHPEDWMALVAAADGVIGADTAPTHLAIMLNKPTLAVFGAIPSHLRIPERFRNADWLTVLDIEMGKPCPCHLNRPFCPVTQQPLCFALTAMTEKIVQKAMEWLTMLL